MNIVGIIQARVGSTRLPRKVLLKLNDRTIIEHVVNRVKKAKKLTRVIVATSDSTKDDDLVNLLEKLNIEFIRGSESDVLERFHRAAVIYRADIIVRICADQPLVDPDAIDQSVSQHIQDNMDFSDSKGENGWPDGTGCEVINFIALEKAQKTSNDAFEREHVKPFFYNNSTNFKMKKIEAPDEIYSPEYSFAIDTQEDFEKLKRIYENFQDLDFIPLKKIILFLNEQKGIEHQ